MNKLLFILFIFSCFNGITQQTDKVDFIRIDAEIRAIHTKKKIEGTVNYTFQVLKSCDSIYLDGINMKILVTDTKRNISITSEENKIWFLSNFKKDNFYTISFSYEAHPKQAIYFTGDQIWTQGQGKYTSNWLPSVDDMNDKIEFDLSIIASKTYEVIANGKLDSVVKNSNHNVWHFNMDSPMSSYLTAFAIGDFDKLEMNSESEIPLKLYYEPKDSLKVEPTYRYSKQLFDFLENEIGVPYPWQNYKEVPVRDFLYAGMENTTATIFSEAFVVDSIGFNDRNYVNVNAHEMAHHWFGNLVTESSGKHHWLQEGFSTYFALLAEKELFGSDYFYWKLYQSAEQLKMLSDEGKGQSLLDSRASSLTFYEKGAWALHILKEMIGEKTFKTAITNYLNNNRFKNVTTDDFLNEVKNVYEGDLSQFKKDWLEQSAFKTEESYRSLIKSSFIQNFFEISALRERPLIDKKTQLSEALELSNDYIGQEIIYQLEGEPISESIDLYQKGFKSKNLFIRQTIALSLVIIPIELKEDYESLLDDESYVTKETALYNLWNNFPEDRMRYLNTFEGIQGFQNKNIRQLWLVLALITEEYKTNEKSTYLKELKEYTSLEHSFEIRKLAISYINELELWDGATLKNLVNACTHHNWRFRNAARIIFNEVLDHDKYTDQIKIMINDFTEKEVKFLHGIMDNK